VISLGAQQEKCGCSGLAAATPKNSWQPLCAHVDKSNGHVRPVSFSRFLNFPDSNSSFSWAT